MSEPLYKLSPRISSEREAYASIGGYQTAPTPALDVGDKGNLVGEVVSGSPGVMAAARLTTMLYDTGPADPNYDGFKRWDELGIDEKYLDDFLNAENELEASLIEARLMSDVERERVIENYGLAGEMARFVGDVALDPTVYATFGAAGMLKAGMSAKSAYALSGAGGGAAYAGLDALGRPEEASAAKALGYTAAGFVVGGLMGTAVDTFKGLKKKGIVNKDFSEMAGDAMQDAYTVPSRATFESLSAAVPEHKIHDYSVGGGMLARGAMKLMRQASPRAYMQTGKLKTTQETGARVLGYNTRTVTEMEEGISGYKVNIGEEVARGRDAASKAIIAFAEEMEANNFKASPEDYDIVFRATFDESFDVSSLTPLQSKVVNFGKPFYGSYEERIKNAGVDGFLARDNYGMPLIFSKEKASADIKGLTQKIETRLVNAQKSAKSEASQIESSIAKQKKIRAGAKDKAKKIKIDNRIKQLEESLEDSQRVMRASLEELQEDAAIAAQRIAAGDFSVDAKIGAKDKNTKTSRFFKERLIDPLEFSDYLDTNPIRLAIRYADSVEPHIALKRAYPEFDSIDEVIEDYKVRAREEASQLGINANKEIEGVANRIEAMWHLETGVRNMRSVRDLGDLAPAVQSVNSMMYTTQMTGQVFAAAMEPANVMLHRGLAKGGAGLTSAVVEFATDPELRKIATNSTKHYASALEVGNAKVIQDLMGHEVLDAEVSGAISRTTRKGALLMSQANLSVYYDQYMRTVLPIVQERSIYDDLLNYQNLKKINKADLAYLGLDRKSIPSVIKQIEKHGVTTEVGSFSVNIAAWDDEYAADIWIRAIRKDLRRTSVMPDTGDVPYVFRTPIGSLLAKYKTWSLVASQKLMVQSLQKGAHSLPAVAMLVGTGAMIQSLLDLSQGKEVSTDPDELLWAGINRSGVLGILPEVGGSYLMNKLFGIQSGGARYYQYTDAAGIMAGPAGNFASDVLSLGEVLPERQNDGSYQSGFIGRDGSIKQGSINSTIDLLPIPLVKPWLKSAAQGNYE